jgi:nucleoside-diphosphate-sugar epimerase
VVAATPRCPEGSVPTSPASLSTKDRWIIVGLVFFCLFNLTMDLYLVLHSKDLAERAKYIFSTEFKTVDQLMDIYEAVTGRPRPRLRLPPAVMLGLAHVTAYARRCLAPNAPQRFTPGAVRILRMQRRANIAKARTELGYQPTTIRQAIEEQYAFFVSQGRIRRPGPALA